MMINLLTAAKVTTSKTLGKGCINNRIDIKNWKDNVCSQINKLH